MSSMHTLKEGSIRGAKTRRQESSEEPPPPSRTGVVRSRQRMAGGVAAGIARHFNIDPLIPRIGFVLLTVLAGAGALLYVLAWLALPTEDGPGKLESAFGGEPRRGVVAIGGLALLAVGGSLLVAGLPGLLGSGLSVAIYLIGLGLGALWWRRGATRTSGRREPEPRRAAPAPRGTPTPTATPSAGGRGGRSIAWAALAAAAVLAGAGALLASSWTGTSAQTALAVVAALIAAGLGVSAYVGRAPGLATVGVLVALALVAVTAIDVPLGGGVGDARWVPTSAEELQDEYRFTAGDAVLDLRQLDLPPGRHTVAASVGVGNLRVHVPDAAGVAVDARVSAGDIDLRYDGVSRRENGVDATATTNVREGADAGIELELGVGFGALQVR